MASFKDKNGVEWRLELDVGLVTALRTRVDFDVGTEAQASGTFGEVLFADKEKLVRVLWIICEEQAEKAKIEPEAFGRAFTGPVLSRATDALIDCITDFTHRPAVAAAMKEKMVGLLAGVEAKAIEAFNRAADSLLSANATVLPVSPESIPQG